MYMYQILKEKNDKLTKRMTSCEFECNLEYNF